MLRIDHVLHRTLSGWQEAQCLRHLSRRECAAIPRAFRQAFAVNLVSHDRLAWRPFCSTATVGDYDARLDDREIAVGFKTSFSTSPTSLRASEPSLATHCQIPQYEESGSQRSTQDKHDISRIQELDLNKPYPESKGKVSPFAVLERSKEHRLLVNRILKDKGRLSYDWRVPVWLLEQSSYQESLRNIGGGTNLRSGLYQPSKASLEPAGYTSTLPIRRLQSRSQNAVKLARDVPRPDTWTTSNLANYIEDLARSQYFSDKIAQTPLARTQRSSNLDDVVKRFQEVFYSRETQEYLSPRAYNVALRFYNDHGIISKARSLYVQMEDSNLEIGTETINNMLRGAASSQDLHNFTFILQKSIRRGFKPDIETWNMLLMAITSKKVKAMVIQRMRVRNVLHSLSMKRGSARIIFSNEVAFHIDNHGDRGPLLSRLDECYGDQWLTTFTGNRLLDEFGKRHTVSENLELLYELRVRGFKADNITLNTLLHHCLLLRQHSHAIEVLQMCKRHFNLDPGKAAYEALFLLAWKSQSFNFAKTAWTFACKCGLVTFKMRDLVFRSLVAGLPIKESMERIPKFNELAGRFLIGAEKLNDSNQFGVHAESEPRQRQSAADYAQVLIRNKLNTIITAPMQQNLGENLLEARDLDIRWAAEKFSENANLDRMIQEGIQISRVTKYIARTELRSSPKSNQSTSTYPAPKAPSLSVDAIKPSTSPSTGVVESQAVKHEQSVLPIRKPKILVPRKVPASSEVPFRRVSLNHLPVNRPRRSMNLHKLRTRPLARNVEAPVVIRKRKNPFIQGYTLGEIAHPPTIQAPPETSESLKDASITKSRKRLTRPLARKVKAPSVIRGHKSPHKSSLIRKYARAEIARPRNIQAPPETSELLRNASIRKSRLQASLDDVLDLEKALDSK